MSCDALSTGTTCPYNSNNIADFILGCLYVVCFSLGIPGNLLALIFFTRDKCKSNRREFFRILFVMLTLIHLVACLTLPPIIDFMFHNRHPNLFRYTWFCSIWGMLWEVIPFYSVFIVAIMSISRTLSIISPLKPLHLDMLIASCVSYLLLIIILKSLPFINQSTEQFTWDSAHGYCYLELTHGRILDTVFNIMNIVFLALPFIPIVLSCISSVLLLYRTLKSSNKMSPQDIINQHKAPRPPPILHQAPSLSRLERISLTSPKYGLIKPGPPKKERRKSTTQQMAENSTITIIVLSAVYVTFNIPVFINYVYYLSWMLSDTDYSSYYNNVFLYQYFWNITYVFAVVANGTINPFVYFWRISSFRNYVLQRFRCYDVNRFLGPGNFNVLDNNRDIRGFHGRISVVTM